MTVPFREIWCADFEYRSDPGERPFVVCLVAREFRTGREIRMWRDELLALRRAPFNTGRDAVFITYYAPAELGCFLELNWPLPVNVVDLFVEHRVATNDEPRRRTRAGDPPKPRTGNRLIDALAIRGLPHIDATDKDAMRQLVTTRWELTEEDRRGLLDYCASDVTALFALLPVMAPAIDWPRATLRGRYMGAVAHMERLGIPIDLELFLKLVANWEVIKLHLIAQVDAAYGVFEGKTLKRDRFAQYLAAHDIDWPRLMSGALALDGDTFKERTVAYPQLQQLQELLVTLNRFKHFALGIGADGRNRCGLSPFRTITGRNQPSADRDRPTVTGFVFGPARWIRGLIRPGPSRAVAYCDWTAQEVAIAAGLSGDVQLARDYQTDIYLRFANAAGIAPPDATKETHATVREICKQIVLGVGYGMGPETMAFKAGISKIEARELMRAHRATYPQFWRWIEGVVNSALFTGQMRTVFGWRLMVDKINPNPRTLMNFLMQANGAEMMRVAAIAATEAGIEVCAPIHDAFLIEAPIDRIEFDTATMCEIMTRAGRLVAGIDVRTEANIVRWPDRYMDKRGAAMWDTVMTILGGLGTHNGTDSRIREPTLSNLRHHPEREFPGPTVSLERTRCPKRSRL